MDVGVQGRADALDPGHCPAATPNAQQPPPALLESEQRPCEHPQDGTAQAVVVDEPIAQSVRERQHPLPNWQAAEHAVDEVSGQLTHATAAARRADAALAGEGDQDLPRATVAAKASKAPRHRAAGEQLEQLTFDEPRQALAATAQARLGQEGFEVLSNHLVQGRLNGLAADVCVLVGVLNRVRGSGGTLVWRKESVIIGNSYRGPTEEELQMRDMTVMKKHPRTSQPVTVPGKPAPIEKRTA